MSKETGYTLTRLSEEHTKFLETYTTAVNINGQTWYNLPFWYRKDAGCYFEILPTNKVSNEVKSFQSSENQQLLEALKEIMTVYERDGHLLNFNVDIARKAIQNTENQSK